MLPVKKKTIEVSYVETKPFTIPAFVIPVHYLKVGGFLICSLILFTTLTSYDNTVPKLERYMAQNVGTDAIGIVEVCGLETKEQYFTSEEAIDSKKNLSLEIRTRAIELLNEKWNPKTRTFYKKGKGKKFNKQSTKIVVDKKEMLNFVPDFIVEEVLYGVPALASITAAQTDIESNWFNSDLAIKSNNGFGIKYVKKWDKDPEIWLAQYRGGHVIAHDDKPTDKFIKFETKWASIRFHTKFLTLLHYKKHIGKDFMGWANGLKASRYATDKNYPQTLKSRYEVLDLATVDAIAYQLRKEFRS